MPQYTIQVQASDEAEQVWQGMHPSENLEADSEQDAGQFVAHNQNIAFGDHWRVLVWEGEDADTSSTPLWVYWPGSTETE